MRPRRWLLLLAILLIIAGCENPFYTKVNFSGSVKESGTNSGVASSLYITPASRGWGAQEVLTADDGSFSTVIDLQQFGCYINVLINAPGRLPTNVPVVLNARNVKRTLWLEVTTPTTIYGYVYKAGTSEPLSQVLVQAKTNVTYPAVYTDSNGWFSVNIYTTQSNNFVTVTFTKSSFKSKIVTIESPGSSHNLDIVYLEPL